ncbi:ComEC/Rec2 family competence protein [Flavobacterium sp. NRK1]|uniref:ComEC/Rec2 family competence protein n=1 Tax=Flavobacterium sp. NRK1 TaxID=2954929 RepID=UPI002091EA48|nr:ComEC/Rec2 family competence protein [Flavobacterium sp. NRK1]MCO6148128.1 ComEC family competence protein [Flavobacterium sp. NRK1]
MRFNTDSLPALKYPIAVLTLFLALGIIIGDFFKPSPETSLIVCSFTFIILIIAYWHSKKTFLPKPYFGIAAFSFMLALGSLIQILHYSPNNKLHYSHYLKNTDNVIKGIILERLKPNNYQEKYYLEVVSVNKKKTRGKILLTTAKDSLKTLLFPGDIFIIADTPTAIAKPLNPNQFDYAAYMEKQDIFYQLQLRSNYIKTGRKYNFNYYLGLLRFKLSNSFKIHNYSTTLQNTLNALLLGQRQDIDTATNNSYRDAGVMHILAISGLHFAVLFYALINILKPLKRLKNKGKIIQLITILILLWGFAFITGLSASVVRSVIMFSFISIGKYLNRQTPIYNSIAISMLVLLVAKPGFIFDAGFQLSYLAVFAIVWFEPFYQQLKTSKFKAVNYFRDTVLVSLSAQVGVLPLILFYFKRFPLLFLLANLIVIPLSNIILLLGLIVLLLNFIWIDATLLLGKLLGFVVTLMNLFIAWIASFESFIIKDIPFTLLLTCTLYIVIFLFGLWIYKKNFIRTVFFLVSILLLQCTYTLTVLETRTNQELIVFNDYKNTSIALKQNNSITFISDDSLMPASNLGRDYTRDNFNLPVNLKKKQNIIWFNGKKILLIDKDCIIQNIKPDIVILTESAKINLERIIKQYKPRQVIADGTNYKTKLSQWRATCRKEKIPFHATAEKGFYRIVE